MDCKQQQAKTQNRESTKLSVFPVVHLSTTIFNNLRRLTLCGLSRVRCIDFIIVEIELGEVRQLHPAHDGKVHGPCRGDEDVEPRFYVFSFFFAAVHGPQVRHRLHSPDTTSEREMCA